jgi:biotin synthase
MQTVKDSSTEKSFMLETGLNLFRTSFYKAVRMYIYRDKVLKYKSIKSAYSDCAITLSIGEHSYEDYKNFFEAGADRYLLRHETATDEHYNKLHPKELSLAYRKQCLYNLKEIGFQVGTGFMVGSPFQTMDNIGGGLIIYKGICPKD